VTLLTGLREALTCVVGRARVVRRMAGVAVGRNRPESPTRMTLRTEQAPVTTGQGKGAVIVAGRRPGHGAMALFAGLWEIQTDVIGSPGVVARVAGIAVRRDRREPATGMALGTKKATMTAGQSETSVVIGCRGPSRGTVTRLARLWETLTGVVRRAAVVAGVAIVAIRGDGTERTTCVALGAEQSTVTSCQGEDAVIVAGWRPGGAAVTRLTRVREIQADMIGCARVVRRMTGVAIRRDRSERPAGVTLGTVETAMTTGQHETTVIVRDGCPARGVVALFAGLRETLANVVGRAAVVTGMAVIAI